MGDGKLSTENLGRNAAFRAGCIFANGV